MKYKLGIFLGLLLMTSLVLAACGNSAPTSAVTQTTIGNATPLGGTKFGIGLPLADFQATGMDGKPVKLSDYRGKVVLVNFWSVY